MDRRNVLKMGAVLLVVPAGLVLQACGGDGGGGGGGGDPTVQGGPGGGGTDAGPQTFTATSSTVNAHHHRFTVQGGELDAPPSEGISGLTTSDMAHVHVVELSAGDLEAIAAGDTVTKETSVTNGHTHRFDFRLS